MDFQEYQDEREGMAPERERSSCSVPRKHFHLQYKKMPDVLQDMKKYEKLLQVNAGTAELTRRLCKRFDSSGWSFHGKKKWSCFSICWECFNRCLARWKTMTIWRRGRDSNPRSFHSAVFKTAALSRSATPPHIKSFIETIIKEFANLNITRARWLRPHPYNHARLLGL